MTWRFRIIFTIIFLGVMVPGWYFFEHRKPQTDFDVLFADMSIGVPEHESVLVFTHPTDAVKGDYFAVTFAQSDTQFHHFVATTGVAETQLLSSTGARVKVGSKMDPQYPWQLSIKAEITNAPDKRYLVSIQGQQPYN